MNIEEMKKSILVRFDRLAKAEKVTRADLSTLSRDLLVYVMETHDIDVINRLHIILTPHNAAMVVEYFKHFLPWDVEKDKNDVFQRFGKMTKGERKQKDKLDLINEWLSVETNDIWVWSDLHLDTVKKKKDFAGNISRMVKQALEGDEKTDTPALDIPSILDAVMQGGIPLMSILETLDMKQKMKAEIEAVMQKFEKAA